MRRAICENHLDAVRESCEVMRDSLAKVDWLIVEREFAWNSKLVPLQRHFRIGERRRERDRRRVEVVVSRLRRGDFHVIIALLSSKDVLSASTRLNEATMTATAVLRAR